MIAALWYSVVMLSVLLGSLLLAASPSPSASPTPLPDPCGSILSIVTRPTVTTSVCTVRARHVLLETGYDNTTASGANGGETPSFPQALLRLGTSDAHLEVDLGIPSHTNDGSLGAKYELGYSQNAVWGANVQVTLPAASPAFTSGVVTYTANVNWSYMLTSVFGLGGTVGFDAQNYAAFVPTLEATAALPHASQLFAEYAYFSRSGVMLGPHTVFDGGLYVGINPHVQIDIECGVQPSLLNGQRQHYVGAGLAFMN
jgi:hypothetical protein